MYLSRFVHYLSDFVCMSPPAKDRSWVYSIAVMLHAYVQMSQLFKLSFEITLTFTSTFVLEVITWVPFMLGS